MTTKRLTAVTIWIHVVLMLAAYFGLATFFDFPDVLRRSAPEMLAAFNAERGPVIASYTLFMLSQVAFMAVALLLHRALARRGGSTALNVATGFGLVAGFAQAIGFSRWVFVVPWIADLTADPSTSAATQAAAMVTLEGFHRVVGVAIGEHLFFWCEAIWAIGLALHLLREAQPLRRLAAVLATAGALVAVYTFEQHGGPFAALGPLNVAAHGALLFWLLGLSLVLWRGRGVGRPALALLTSAYLAIVVPSFL